MVINWYKLNWTQTKKYVLDYRSLNCTKTIDNKYGKIFFKAQKSASDAFKTSSKDPFKTADKIKRIAPDKRKSAVNTVDKPKDYEFLENFLEILRERYILPVKGQSYNFVKIYNIIQKNKEYQQVTNLIEIWLFNYLSLEQENWVKICDNEHGTYFTNSQFKFKTTM